jgi:hypothetical protein
MRTPSLFRHLMIGSDEHLRALGLLTLDFSAADEVLAEYIFSLTAISNSAEGTDLTDLKEKLQNRNFSGKIKDLGNLIRVISYRYGVEGGNLDSQLEAAAKIADHRNDIIHGWLTWDPELRRPAFLNKKKPLRGATVIDIGRLCKQIDCWFDDIREAYISFLGQLEERMKT